MGYGVVARFPLVKKVTRPRRVSDWPESLRSEKSRPKTELTDCSWTPFTIISKMTSAV